MSARSAVALHHGADEELFAAIDDGPSSDSLSAEHRAALALADAYLGHPAGLTDRDRSEIAEQLSRREVTEAVLKLVSYSHDKVMVALGFDFDEIRPFTID